MSYKGINYHNIFASKSHDHDDKYAQIVHEHDSTYHKKGENISLPNKLTFDKNSGGIYGTTTTGESIEAFNVCGTDDSLAIGWGGYKNALSSTKIFGNNLSFLSKGKITFDKQIEIPSLLVGNKEAFSGELKSVYNTDGGCFKLGGLMVAYGKAEFSGFIASTLVPQTITFPKEFSAVPMICLTKNSAAPDRISVGVSSLTTTSFTLNFYVIMQLLPEYFGLR